MCTGQKRLILNYLNEFILSNNGVDLVGDNINVLKHCTDILGEVSGPEDLKTNVEKAMCMIT